MTLVWLTLLVSCVDNAWGFCIGVALVFFGILTGEADSPIAAIVLTIVGVILVLTNVSM